MTKKRILRKNKSKTKSKTQTGGKTPWEIASERQNRESQRVNYSSRPRTLHSSISSDRQQSCFNLSNFYMCAGSDEPNITEEDKLIMKFIMNPAKTYASQQYSRLISDTENKRDLKIHVNGRERCLCQIIAFKQLLPLCVCLCVGV